MEDRHRLSPVALLIALLVAGALLAGWSLMAAPARAVGGDPPPTPPPPPPTCTVTNLNDAGPDSLRQCLIDIQAGGVIDFDPALTQAGPATITLTSGSLAIAKSLTIAGPGADLLTVSGNDSARILEVSDMDLTVTVAGLTLRDGYDSNGGGIAVLAGTVTLDSLHVTSNAASQMGGGLAVGTSAVVYVDASTFGGNAAGSAGGAIVNHGVLRLTNSTFYSNTISTVGSSGSALLLFGDAEIVNTTVYSNPVSPGGGAIYLHTTGSYTLTHVLVGASGEGSNCDSFATDLLVTRSLSDDSSCGVPTMDAANPQQDWPFANPFATVHPTLLRFGAFGNYGGATPTLPPLPGNVAIDTGDDTACPADDQRGIARPQGPACDIGAFESHGFSLTLEAGDEQSTLWGMDFDDPFDISVSATGDEPVDGGLLYFGRPASGAGISSPTDGVDIVAGRAVVTGTANDLVGSYVLTATTTGVTTPVIFNLTNLEHATEIAVSVDPTQAVYGEYLLFTATVTDTDASSPVAGGWVTFTVTDADDDLVWQETGWVSGGMAYGGASSLPVGTYTLTAAYAQTDEPVVYRSSTSSEVSLTVDPLPTTIDLSNMQSTSVYGSITTFEAQVTVDHTPMPARVGPPSFIATGVVTFTEGSTTLATVALDATGRATFSTNTLPGGHHQIVAVYGGDAICAPGDSDPLRHIVLPRASEIGLYALSEKTAYGQTATFIATVRGVTSQGLLGETDLPAVPTGQVIFKEGATEIGTASLDQHGVAMLRIATLTAGDHTVTAHYQGDDNYAAVTSASTTHTVDPTAATIGVDTVTLPSRSLLGESVTFTVTIHGGLRPTAAARAAAGATLLPPTGTVRLKEGDTVLDEQTLVDGSAVFTLDALELGSHTLIVDYAGDANYAARTSDPFTHTVFTRLFIPLAISPPPDPGND